MLGTNVIHKYMNVLKFAYLETWGLTLKDPILLFAGVILEFCCSTNSVTFAPFRAAPGRFDNIDVQLVGEFNSSVHTIRFSQVSTNNYFVGRYDETYQKAMTLTFCISNQNFILK